MTMNIASNMRHTARWERIDRAIQAVYEQGYNAYPIEKETVCRNAEGAFDELEDNFTFIPEEIKDALDEIRYNLNEIIADERRYGTC